ncbi:hypothetical protein LOD99_5348 [Oopsacas minuta]|uniref:Uncharacterized protein n=1 Tax=Oopsacas minuta TaxID=111878 RepID=A0AAV7JQN8_9METZ|nr:hypothetical protein LOD99_5348 [Oopsacas minuta]
MVWEMMGFQALSDLHFLPSKQTVSADYYLKEILEKTCVNALNRKRKKGDLLTRKMLPNMSFILSNKTELLNLQPREPKIGEGQSKIFLGKGEFPRPKSNRKCMRNTPGSI